MTERDNQELQETLASEEQYKQGTQRSTSKEQEVVQAEAGQSEEERVLQKEPKYCDPATKLLRLLVGGNLKSNKACAKITARKKCAGPYAFLH